MRIRSSSLAGMAVLLAGCSAIKPSNELMVEATAQPSNYTEIQRKIVELAERPRFGVLLRAIRNGGAPCQGVVEGVRQRDRGGAPSFLARCWDGPRYEVAITSTGMAQVTRVDQETSGQTR